MIRQIGISGEQQLYSVNFKQKFCQDVLFVALLYHFIQPVNTA